MKFLDLATARYSERQYDPSKEVSEEQLQYILSCGAIAPSAVNKQPWRFIVLRGSAARQMGSIYKRETFKDAPLCIAMVGNHSLSWHRYDGKDHCDIDVAIATTHMILAAQEVGVCSCWVGNFEVEACHELLQLSSDEEVIALLPMGFPSEKGGPLTKKRKSLEDIVTYIDKF